MSNNSYKHPKCGEIWMCDMSAKYKSVQNGYRPVFILSNDKNNVYSPTLNVIPITTKMNKRNLPVHVELWDYDEYGLKEPSTMIVEQITTISAECLDYKIGKINDYETLNNICKAISVQFPIMQLVSVC